MFQVYHVFHIYSKSLTCNISQMLLFFLMHSKIILANTGDSLSIILNFCKILNYIKFESVSLFFLSDLQLQNENVLFFPRFDQYTNPGSLKIYFLFIYMIIFALKLGFSLILRNHFN